MDSQQLRLRRHGYVQPSVTTYQQGQPMFAQEQNFDPGQYQHMLSPPPGYTVSGNAGLVRAQGNAPGLGPESFRTSSTQDLRASMTGYPAYQPRLQAAVPQQEAFIQGQYANPNPSSVTPHHIPNGIIPSDRPQSCAPGFGTGASASNGTKRFQRPASLGPHPTEQGKLVPNPLPRPSYEPESTGIGMEQVPSPPGAHARNDDANSLANPLYAMAPWPSRKRRRRSLSMSNFSEDERPEALSHEEMLDSIPLLERRLGILQRKLDDQTQNFADQTQNLEDQKQEIERFKKSQDKLEETVNTLRHLSQQYHQGGEDQHDEAGSHPGHKSTPGQDLADTESTSTHFKVLHIPANGTPPRIISLPLINIQSEGTEDANLGRLPDMRSFWGNEGWSSREVIQTIFGDRDLAAQDINAVYYILKTKAENNLLPNQHFEFGVWGDVCIMRQATQPFDEEGLTRYVDISKNVLVMHYWKVMFKDVLKVRQLV